MLHSRLITVGRAILFLLIFVALVLNAPRNESGEGERKKVWSGKSYKAQTVVAAMPSAAAAPGFDSERVWSGEDDWEPAVAADPSSNFVYQLTTRYSGPAACNGCPFPVIVFRSSSNNGVSWGADKFLAITKKAQNDPQIEVATDGAIFVLWLDAYNPGVKFTKSTNRGASWSTPFAFTGKNKKPNWSDRPILAISRDGRDVYAAFNSSDSYVASSHNFGQTWSANVKTSSDTRYWFHSAGAVAPNGTVYFATADYSQDYTGDTHIGILRSTNGGASWTHVQVDTSREMPDCSWADGCYFGFLGPSAGIAVDSTGRVVLAYNAGNSVGGAQRMYTRYSTDDGNTWGARQEVSDPGASVNNGFPALSAGNSAGDFRLIWQDDRNGATTSWNSWYRRSTNGGATWSSAIRLSDLATGAPYKTANGYKFPYGDYLEIAVDAAGRNHFVWGEGDSYTGPGGTWYTRGQ
ncbi:glycoside hydrolase [bacterium]|nr:glycoside hydrolase [bacterium]